MTQISQGVHAHKLVAETAKGICREMYAGLMSNNKLYDAWKKQNEGLGPKALEDLFVARRWGMCLEEARATLTGMLLGPLDERLKETIHEALVLDRSLMRGRKTGRQKLAQVLRKNEVGVHHQ